MRFRFRLRLWWLMAGVAVVALGLVAVRDFDGWVKGVHCWWKCLPVHMALASREPLAVNSPATLADLSAAIRKRTADAGRPNGITILKDAHISMSAPVRWVDNGAPLRDRLQTALEPLGLCVDVWEGNLVICRADDRMFP